MTACPVCDSSSVEPFLLRERVPVTQNVIVETAELARALERGTLEMCCCSACGFAFNRRFDAGLVAYGDQYDNTQTHSPAFKSYFDDLVSRLVDDLGIEGARIVEVGCGKGHFLRALVERGAGNVGWGFDPSYVGPDTDVDGRVTFRREFYGPGSDVPDADVVVCRHVIEHVQDPVALLQNIRAALEAAPRARVFFETPCLEWILKNVVIWDFFYEHCSLFTKESLTTAFERAGFCVERCEHTFGEQYLWLEAVVAQPREPQRNPANIPDLARQFAVEERRQVERWKQELVARPGKVALWGAGAKGVTFANLADPDCALIDCVVDLNPHKQNRYLAGTGHPIVPPAALGARGIKRAILMNPNYRDENVALLRGLGLDVQLEDPTT